MANQERERMPKDEEEEDSPRGSTSRDVEDSGRARNESTESAPSSERGRGESVKRGGSMGDQSRRNSKTLTRKK